ncbi:MAG: hypothetical protein ACE5I0_05560, partial [Candidatus Binatia bacterium]
MAARHITYLHWQTEEFEIRYPEWMAPETARTIIQELLAGERIPAKGPEREPTGRVEIPSTFRRLWQGVHTRPEGTYVVGVHGDTCMIERLDPHLAGGGE